MGVPVRCVLVLVCGPAPREGLGAEPHIIPRNLPLPCCYCLFICLRKQTTASRVITAA